MTHQRLRCEFPVILLALGATQPCWSAQYAIQDLGLGTARAINNRGQIVGIAPVGHFGKPVIWEGSQMTPLALPEDSGGIAVAINETGMVAGYWSPPKGYQIYQPIRPVFWINGTPIDIPVYGWGAGVNDSGQGVGHYIDQPASVGQPYVFTFDGHQSQNIALGAASAINNSGQVAGNDFATSRPCVWSAGSVTYLNDFGSGFAAVTDINDLGQVVGYSQTAEGIEHASLWNSPTALDLGSLGAEASRAHAINNLGQVVGYIWDEGNYRAFVYSDGQMHDLNNLIPADSGWSLYEAYDINDHGQIVGYGSFEGQAHAFLLTPIPEPASLSLFSFVVTALVRRGRSGRVPVA